MRYVYHFGTTIDKWFDNEVIKTMNRKKFCSDNTNIPPEISEEDERIFRNPTECLLYEGCFRAPSTPFSLLSLSKDELATGKNKNGRCRGAPLIS